VNTFASSRTIGRQLILAGTFVWLCAATPALRATQTVTIAPALMTSTVQADLAYETNVSRSAFRADRLSDTSFALHLPFFEAYYGDVFSKNPWSFLFELGGHVESRLRYSDFNEAWLNAFASLTRTLGSTPDAPSLSLNVGGGSTWRRTSALGGLNGQAGLSLLYHFNERLHGGLDVSFDRLDTRDGFFSRSGHSIGAYAIFEIYPRVYISIHADQYDGDELSYADAARATTAPFSAMPRKAVAMFGRPFDAYQVDARARSIALGFDTDIGWQTLLSVRMRHEMIHWGGLSYPDTRFTLSLVKAF
jgi:hypothetical protein